MKDAASLLEWKVLRAFDSGSLQIWMGSDGKAEVSRISRERFNASASKAVATAHKKGFIEPYKSGRGYTRWRLTDLGRAVLDGERPAWTPPQPPPLDDRDMRVLRSMMKHDLSGPATSGKLRAIKGGQVHNWHAPIGLGGTNGSHHSASLRKLAKHGYVAFIQGREREFTGASAFQEPTPYKQGKGSCLYRITDAGMEKVRAHVGTKV